MRLFRRARRIAGAQAGSSGAGPSGAVASGAGPSGAEAASGAEETVTPAGPVNGHHILETVATLPISTWRYLWEPEHTRHLGPMAQDWHAAFDFGHENTRVIPLVDANGITLVCVQALTRRIDELTAEVAQLRTLCGQPTKDRPQETP